METLIKVRVTTEQERKVRGWSYFQAGMSMHAHAHTHTDKHTHTHAHRLVGH